MTLHFSWRARADLEDIRDFLLARSPQGADNVRVAIDRTLSLLEERPLLGRPRQDLRVRSIHVARYPYTIYYCLMNRAVLVVHIRDDRRKPPGVSELR